MDVERAVRSGRERCHDEHDPGERQDRGHEGLEVGLLQTVDFAYNTRQLAEAYDAVYAGVEDASFWLDVLSAAPSGPLLELACGTGRVLVPLARAGYAVTGLDLSAEMLSVCRDRVLAEPAEVAERVTLVQGDMTDFELGEQFAAIIIAFNSFHHLRTVEQQLSCLRRCREHLLPDGILVLDLFNPDPAPEIADAASTAADAKTTGARGPAHEAEGATADADDGEFNELTVEWTEGRRVRRWMSACDYDREHQCNDCEMTYEVIGADGSRETLVERFGLRIIYRYELEHLLARCGFRIQALHGDYEGAPFAAQSLGMIAVARLADEAEGCG